MHKPKKLCVWDLLLYLSAKIIDKLNAKQNKANLFR